MNAAIDNILDEVAKYSVNDKEMILRILEKRLVDEKRDILYKKYKKSVRDYRSGKVKTGSAEDLFDSIND
jgi:hypothetical protein